MFVQVLRQSAVQRFSVEPWASDLKTLLYVVLFVR
jgi:hypothetical protein